ncbi:hypothetical protein V6Z11_A05G359800 [Gossypium hirsutum]
MSICLAPKGVIDDIQAMLSRTWWSGKDKGGFWTMIPWKTLCKPKGMGGLGIRDVRLFNLALLGRQVWRLLNNTDSLCFKVLSSKYFPDGNIFHAKKVDKASFTWSSIAKAVEAFQDGFGWQVGNGEKINICEKFVKDLWHLDRRSWDENKVKQAYGQDWGDKICDIPIGDEGFFGEIYGNSTLYRRFVFLRGGWDMKFFRQMER